MRIFLLSSLYFLLGILLKGMINDQHWMIRFSSFEPSLFLEEPIKLYFIVIRITNEKWICCLPLEHLMNTIFLWYRGEYYKKIYQFCKYDNISFWLFAVLPYLRIWEFFLKWMSVPPSNCYVWPATLTKQIHCAMLLSNCKVANSKSSLSQSSPFFLSNSGSHGLTKNE